jgi:hypothetical protein
MTRRTLRTLASAFLTIARLVGFIGGGIAGPRFRVPSLEFPLGDVRDIAIDRDGTIALALGFCGRVQLYDPRGRFLRGWPADARGGSFTVAFRSPGVVASHAVRRGTTVLFDSNGTRIGELTESPDSEEGQGQLSVAMPDGSTVRIHHRLLWPTLVREATDGTASVLAPGSWWLRPLTGPVTCWIVLIAGVMLSRNGPARAWSEIKARRARQQPPSS